MISDQEIAKAIGLLLQATTERKCIVGDWTVLVGRIHCRAVIAVGTDNAAAIGIALARCVKDGSIPPVIRVEGVKHVPPA